MKKISPVGQKGQHGTTKQSYTKKKQPNNQQRIYSRKWSRRRTRRHRNSKNRIDTGGEKICENNPFSSNKDHHPSATDEKISLDVNRKEALSKSKISNPKLLEVRKNLNYKEALCKQREKPSDNKSFNQEENRPNQCMIIGRVVKEIDGNGIPTLNFPSSIHDYWKSTLIIRTIGKLLDLPYLKERLLRLWRIKKTLELHHLGLGFYAVHNLLDEDGIRIFMSQRKIGPNPNLTRSWTPNFKPTAALQQLITTIWSSLPMLPIEY